MKPSDAISAARILLQDVQSGATAPRQTDAELLGWFNDGLKEACKVNPLLFSGVINVTCATGLAEQAITYTNGVRLLDVLRITSGRALTLFDRGAMDAFKPTWRSDVAAAAQQWSPLEGDPLKFFVYPPAPSGQSLDVRVVRNPSVYTIDQEVTDLPDTYKPAMANYIVFRAESKDDESVLSQRAQGAYTAFLAMFGAN